MSTLRRDIFVSGCAAVCVASLVGNLLFSATPAVAQSNRGSGNPRSGGPLGLTGIFDNWQGFTSADIVTIGDATANPVILNVGNGSGTQTVRGGGSSNTLNLAGSPSAATGNIALGGAGGGTMLYTANSVSHFDCDSTNNGVCTYDNGEKMVIGGGGQVSAIRFGTASLTPGSITANSCQTLGIGTVTVTGISASSLCYVAVPGSGSTTGYYCSTSANSCVIIACNPTGSSQTPPSGTYGALCFN